MSDEGPHTITVFCDDSSHEDRRARVGSLMLQWSASVDGTVWDLDGGGRSAASRRAKEAALDALELQYGHRSGLRALAEGQPIDLDPTGERTAHHERVLLGRVTGQVRIDPQGRPHDSESAEYLDGGGGWHVKNQFVCDLCGLNVQVARETLDPLLDALAAAGEHEVTMRLIQAVALRSMS